MSVPSNYNSSDYILDIRDDVITERKIGRASQTTVLRCKDGREWVLLNQPDVVDRFKGFLYLEKKIREKEIINCLAAPNKISKYRGRICYLSEYVGEAKLEFDPFNMKHIQKLQIVAFLQGDARFIDIGNYGIWTNVRVHNEKIYVFDTEKSSFDKSVHPNIDSFQDIHDTILKEAERQLG
ncbi:MAG: hypothetical protein H7A37_07690 [Chlamydiales bacterium]|nr:hypothetical protein [Chlamydiales bacterium]